MAYSEAETSKFVNAGGIKVHYNEAGSGETLILIHGGGPGASGWSNFRRNVDYLAEKYRVIIVDLPGYGKSDIVVPSDRMFGFYANVIHNMMDALDIKKAHFIGNSLGGGTTLKFALDYPDRAGRLVLMGSGGGYPYFTPMMTEGMKILFDTYEGEGPTIEKLRRFISIMVYDASFITDELLKERLAAATKPEIMANPPIKLRGKFPAEELWRERLDLLTHEVLVIWGREDRVVPLDSAFMLMKQIVRARLHVFPQCGHWAQMEKADEFNELVMQFMKG
jgi:4,5:9,10-diseco-3-hydroxy-5,9,17-trioxoandrosta-1(10),2-diene-4-oate hydrolase